MTCRFDLKTFDEHGKSSKALKLAIVIAFIFMLVELISGILAHSLALISDALHMFTDVGAFVMGLIALRISLKPSTSKMSFGYGRAEVLGALGNALTLWALVIVLVYEAIKRMIYPHEVAGLTVFIVAFIGLIANIFMMRILHTHDHDNLNVKAAYLHALGDLLASIGVLISGLIIYFTGWNILDPIITLIIATMILLTSWKVLKASLLIMMEATPSKFSYEELQDTLSGIEGVEAICDLHIWNISPREIALTANIKGSLTADPIKKILQDKFKITHSTLEIHP